MEHITIYPNKLADCWCAWFHGDPQVMTVMGTDVLPTPYTLLVNPYEVRDAIAKRNPQAIVDVRNPYDGGLL